MRKTASLAVAIFVVLLLFVPNVWNAVCYEIPYSKDPLTISIQSPVNKIYTVNNVTFEFTVAKPASWYNSSNKGVRYYGVVTSVTYELDGKYYDEPVLHDNLDYRGPLYFSKILTGLSEGVHTLKITASADSHSFSYVGEYSTSVGGYSPQVSFAVDTIPIVSVPSPLNKTYETDSVTLDLAVNQQVSQIRYCIDNQLNVTIAGNTNQTVLSSGELSLIVQATDTLTGLSNGEHSLIVYAEDMDGNTGSSETIYFTIAQETESPPQPSDFQDSSLPTEYGYATIAIAVAVMAAAIGFVYLRRKK